MLLNYCNNKGWEKAIKLCRYIKEKYLWAILAALSMNQKNIQTAEIALANIDSIDKVQFILKLMEQSPVVKKAELLLYYKKIDEAEELYINEKMHYRAIKLNIKLYRWERAVQLVKKHKVHADTLLAYRERYLLQMGVDESKDVYKQLKKHVGEYDWEKIKAKISEEKASEKTG